jgi:hypothetical protein
MAAKRQRPPRKDQPSLPEALAPGPCSFCGRTPIEHEGLQFQKGEYRICEDCVTRMHRELEQKDDPA